ncbi:Protein of unknown function [Bacillus mycoides]|nr:Protein of unknown function [Bacillus mycoides]
MLPPNTTD